MLSSDEAQQIYLFICFSSLQLSWPRTREEEPVSSVPFKVGGVSDVETGVRTRQIFSTAIYNTATQYCFFILQPHIGKRERFTSFSKVSLGTLNLSAGRLFM